MSWGELCGYLHIDFCKDQLVLLANRIWFPLLIMGQAGAHRSFNVQKSQHVKPNFCIFRLNYEDKPACSHSGELAWEIMNGWKQREKENKNKNQDLVLLLVFTSYHSRHSTEPLGSPPGIYLFETRKPKNYHRVWLGYFFLPEGRNFSLSDEYCRFYLPEMLAK